MKKDKAIVVFDVGKTHKKCFVFSLNFKLLFQKSIQVNEIPDEDGFESDDLKTTLEWMEGLLEQLLIKYAVKTVNFSAHGASFVLIDYNGNPLLPMYNYLKPVDSEIEKEFYQAYPNLELSSASPRSGFLNSGFQLYWLKKNSQKKFKQVQLALHLPQFFHYYFTGNSVSELSSIGCHTSLWDYSSANYQDWLIQEEISDLQAPISSSEKTSEGVNLLKGVLVGIGLHDSSAALVPYLKAVKKSFILLSTGTMNVALNPFCNQSLLESELNQGCLNYMTPNGQAVKASRFFMGGAHEQLSKSIASYFDCSSDFFKTIDYDPLEFDQTIPLSDTNWSISSTDFSLPKEIFKNYSSPTEAYYAIMKTLLQIQFTSLAFILRGVKIERIYLDGGFQKNQIFIKHLARSFADLEVYCSDFSLGAALGAALSVHPTNFDEKNLHAIYGMERI
jgi:sugar (pentulose or hexulose) kinase